MTIKHKVTLACVAAAVCLTLSAELHAGHTNALLIAEMDGREEVGDDPTKRLVGDPNGKGIGYVFGVDGDETTLCYSLIVNNIQLVPVGEGMMAHIHEGQRDANGPVVAVLAGPEDGNAADCLTEGETGKFPTEEVGIVQRILNNPSDFYINIHNPEFPAGAIRANLSNTLMNDDHEHTHDTAAAAGEPSAPMNLSASVYSRSALELFWDRSTDDGQVLMYEVYRDNLLIANVQGNSYFDDSLSSGTTYSYEVVAIDDDNQPSERSTAIDATTF